MKNFKLPILFSILFLGIVFTACKPEVTEITVSSITIKEKPTKSEYTVNDTFDPTGLIITASFSDETTQDITYSASSGITLSQPDMTAAGTPIVTVTYSGKTAEFKITVKEKAVDEDPVKENPTEKDDGKVIFIDGSKLKATDWAFGTITLTDFANKTVTATLSVKTKVITTVDSTDIKYQINTGKTAYPIIATKNFKKENTKYEEITGTKETIECGATPIFYISTYKLTPANYKLYLKDFKLTVTDGTTTKTYTAFDTNSAISRVEDKVEATTEEKEETADKDDDKTDDTTDDKPSADSNTGNSNTTGETIKNPDSNTGNSNSGDANNTTNSNQVSNNPLNPGSNNENQQPTPKTLSSISIKSKPTNVYYNLNDEAIDLQGLSITAKYSDNSTTVITYSSTSGITTSTPDLTTSGSKTITVTYEEKTTTFDIKVRASNDWKIVDSLKETFVDGGFFDYFGLACEIDELGNSSTAEGILYHANTTTPGNELKPQFVFWYYGAAPTLTTYTGSNGVETKVPTDAWMKQQMAIKMDPYLNAAKNAGIQIRGHVLTWHSQTPDFFFEKDWKKDLSSGTMLEADEMTARHEWYIKTVLTHVAEWEAENGYAGAQTEAVSGKKHLIYSWDVVNEAVSDSARDSDTGYLRGAPEDSPTDPNNGGSRWYQIYGNADFIVNAFRFANAYAPTDVTLCYNDYNEYLNYDDGNGGSWKTKGIIRLLNAVKNGEEKTVNGKSVKPRIDAMAMQSHVEPIWMNVSAYEGALKQFLALDIDVQVTEFDIATNITDDTTNWTDYMTMFLKYSKKGSEISNYNGHHITGFTIWGINDENSWISKNGTQYPLIFTKVDGEYLAKGCFDSMMNAAAQYLPPTNPNN